MRVLLFLQARHLINTVRLTFRTPKRLIPVVLIAVWLAMVVLPQMILGRSMRYPMAGMAPMTNTSAWPAMVMFLSVFAGYLLLRAFSESMIVFGMPEIDTLFPTPMSRRTIMAFKLVQVSLKTCGYLLFLVAVLLPSFRVWLALGSLSYLSVWLSVSLFTAVLINLTTSINLAATFRGGNRWWFAWIVRGAIYSIAVFILVSVSNGYRHTHDLQASLHSVIFHPALFLILTPMKWTADLALAQPSAWLTRFVTDFAGMILLMLGSYVLVLTRPENPYEPSLSISMRFAQMRAARRSGNLSRLRSERWLDRRRPTSVTWSIPPFGRGAVALIWKNINAVARTSREPFIVFLLIAGIGLPATQILLPGKMTTDMVNHGALIALFYYVWIAANIMFQGFRDDVKQANMLKPMPIPAWKIVAVLPVHGVIILSVVAWCAVAIIAFSYGVPRTSPLVPFSILLPVVSYAVLSSQVWVAILYPDWSDLSQRSIAGVLMMFVYMFSLGLPAGAGIVLWLLHAGLPILIVAVSALSAVVSVVGIALSAAAYAKYDPTNE